MHDLCLRLPTRHHVHLPKLEAGVASLLVPFPGFYTWETGTSARDRDVAECHPTQRKLLEGVDYAAHVNASRVAITATIANPCIN